MEGGKSYSLVLKRTERLPSPVTYPNSFCLLDGMSGLWSACPLANGLDSCRLQALSKPNPNGPHSQGLPVSRRFRNSNAPVGFCLRTGTY